MYEEKPIQHLYCDLVLCGNGRDENPTGSSDGQPSEVHPYLCHSIFHNLLIRHITLITHQQLIYALGRVTVNLLQPLLDIVEGVHISDVVDNADAVGATVVRGRDCSEALLASCVPL